MQISLALTTILLLPTLASAGFTVNACFQLSGQGADNALVRCFDADWGIDDRVGKDARTNSNGCVAIRDDQRWYERPDIYCQIYADGECFATTTTRTIDDHSTKRNANLGTIELSYDHDYCGDFGSSANGCGPSSFPSWLRDVATDVSGFRTQCAVHDRCYDQCNKSRSSCDEDFLSDMLGVCAGSWTCRTLARLFFEAVDEFGRAACEASRKDCASKSLCA